MSRRIRKSRHTSTNLEEDTNNLQTKYLMKKNYDLAKKLSEMEAKYHTQLLENQLLQARTNASVLNGTKEIQMLVRTCWTLLSSFSSEFTKLSRYLLDEKNVLNKPEDRAVSSRTHSVAPSTVEPFACASNLKVKETHHTLSAAHKIENKVSHQNVPIHNNVVAKLELPQENTEYLNVTPENELTAEDLGRPVLNSTNVTPQEETLSEPLVLSTIREEASSAFIEESTATHRHDPTISPISFETHYTSKPVKGPPGNKDDEPKLDRSEFVYKRRGTSSIKTEKPSSPKVLPQCMDMIGCKRSSCSGIKTAATPGKENAGPGTPVRRRTASKHISYVEPPLNKKLRRLT